MNAKDTVPRSLSSNVVYKFNCAECNSAYVAETSRNLSTRVCEHLYTDKNFDIFKHLKSSDKCKRLAMIVVLQFWTRQALTINLKSIQYCSLHIISDFIGLRNYGRI